MRKIVPAALASALLPLLILAALAIQPKGGHAQGLVELGADANITGNSATSISTREGCVRVGTGDTFDLDIFVSNVDKLVAWELYLKFDPAIIEVVDTDMNLFLASNPRSSLTVLSVPLSGGRHFLGAADTSDPESGSGVLARVTMAAKGPGVSEVKFLYRDFDGDGNMDFGPRLTAAGGIAIGDSTGDGVYDEPRPKDAIIAVDKSCDISPPTSTPPPPASGGDTPPSDTSPRATGPGTSLDEEARNELVRVFGVDPDAIDEPSDDAAADDASGPAPAVISGQRTPIAGDQGAAAGGSENAVSPTTSSSSGGGGFPLWGIGLIAATVLVTGAGASVFLVARSGGRFGR